MVAAVEVSINKRISYSIDFVFCAVVQLYRYTNGTKDLTPSGWRKTCGLFVLLSVAGTVFIHGGIVCLVYLFCYTCAYISIGAVTAGIALFAAVHFFPDSATVSVIRSQVFQKAGWLLGFSSYIVPVQSYVEKYKFPCLIFCLLAFTSIVLNINYLTSVISSLLISVSYHVCVHVAILAGVLGAAWAISSYDCAKQILKTMNGKQKMM